MIEPLSAALLPPGVRARHVHNVNGLSMHVLEAGYEDSGRPMLLLLHGFPELAYSWRHVMPALAAAGYHVVAPDQRGFGRTTGWPPGYDVDLDPFRMIGLATDALALVDALGRREVAAVVGHDFGSPVAAWCAIARPDVFRAAVLMSAPFPGTPRLAATAVPDEIHRQLAALPRPRKHYVGYYATRDADADMHAAPQGLSAFLRAYYHAKSGDWAGNVPFPLAAWTAAELARMPTYYIMDAAAGMAATVAPMMPSPVEIAACQWLTDAELAVYTGEYVRTGFQGGLNWYRATIDGRNLGERLFAGRRIDVPCIFIAGARDWGIHQRPAALAAMEGRACSNYRGTVLVEGAGHWVQQERPDDVVRAILGFMAAV
ncbi:alpha/beta fold hydrolase [Sandarakinorhabdus sp. DWP1-3-1]|uniref:alpha/beta hydrolase n=1 Tax=Sandarakinorhabdus sp. DWP1-3-1 TaxID=2804627 RepID=UPI003CED7344